MAKLQMKDLGVLPPTDRSRALRPHGGFDRNCLPRERDLLEFFRTGPNVPETQPNPGPP